MESIFVPIAPYMIWGVPFFLLAAVLLSKQQLNKYRKSLKQIHVLKMFAIFAAFIGLTLVYLQYSQHLNDFYSMKTLGYEWREDIKQKNGFHKNIGIYDVYVNFHHGTNTRNQGVNRDATYVRIYAHFPSLNLTRYFCSDRQASHFKSKEVKAGSVKPIEFPNGHYGDKCFDARLNKAIAKLPNRRFRFTSWQGWNSYFPESVEKNEYLISLSVDEINLKMLDEELKDFLSYYDVLTSSAY